MRNGSSDAQESGSRRVSASRAMEIVGRVLMAIGLLGLVVLQLGAVSP